MSLHASPDSPDTSAWLTREIVAEVSDHSLMKLAVQQQIPHTYGIEDRKFGCM